VTAHSANVACVVLAAGASSRFGSPKQLQLYKGEALVRRAVRAAYGSGAGRVILVTGANADAVEKCVMDFESVHIVRNDRWKEGLSSSIAAGVTALHNEPNIDGALITLGDQPLVDSRCLGRLLSAFDGTHRVVAASYSDTIGAPALFGREHFDFLIQLRGDKGARYVLAEIGTVTKVSMPEAAFDIDETRDLIERD
jgi:molybdenum cofactor cytidylyltransferase